ncbi:hypothetical protein EGW08_009366 [Elysia chlorotica]|uniref:EGF-like domain-containing protein n=1 Tax=Elysia chlorotica TaxID=188477 RepID=A0A3S1A4Z5_ELYCH|nr:hypothetical protein EGW08_009366 [Elysia chlorotica]
MYGFNCSKPCSSHCGGNFKTCFKDDGSCNEGCERGFQPPRCDTACAKGTYGQDCKDNCSEGCSGTDKDCDPADGTCIYGCVAGYWGSKCDNNNCPNQICPMSKPCSHCAGPDNRCYDNRTCMDGCSKGYFGETCDARCPNQTYGLNCAQRCSQNCGGQYKNCDHDGTCVDGCVENYYGDKCDESVDPKDVAAQKPSIMSTLGLSVLLILFLIVVVVTSIIMFYVNRDSKEKRLQEGSTGGIDAKHPTPTSSDGETTNMTTDLTTDMSEMTSSYFTDAEGIRTETGSNESVFDLRSKPAK